MSPPAPQAQTRESTWRDVAPVSPGRRPSSASGSSREQALHNSHSERLSPMHHTHKATPSAASIALYKRAEHSTAMHRNTPSQCTGSHTPVAIAAINICAPNGAHGYRGRQRVGAGARELAALQLAKGARPPDRRRRRLSSQIEGGVLRQH